MALHLTPVAPTERIDVLDVLRGFALCGVLLANMLWFFSGFGDLTTEQVARLPTVVLDPAVLELASFFVVNKFITIFSFLFGVGFALQLRRASEFLAPVARLYLRRMSWLFLLGAAHALLVWYGDILHLYAVLGLLLAGWVTCSDRTLIRWGLVFAIVAPVAVRALLWGLPSMSGGSVDPMAGFESRWEAATAGHTAFTAGSYPGIVRANAGELYAWLATDHALTTGLASFGKFLLGFWAGRSGILVRAASACADSDDPAVVAMRRGLAWGLAIGVACEGILVADKAFPALDADTWGAKVAESALWHAGVLALATSYVCGIVLLFRRRDWNRTLLLLAPVGRMALTNYLGQSIICILIFYGLGLGWYGRVGPTAVLGISIGVFSAQAAVSAWWLQRFRFGPAEWAWRSLTYGRRQPFRLA
jgi:uncharacterized protein